MLNATKIKFLATAFCFVVWQQKAISQPPPPTGLVHVVTIGITSITPATAIAGQPVTVNYSVLQIGASTTPVTGQVIGSFQGSALKQPNGAAAPSITLHPRSPITGTLVIPAPNAGSGEISLGMYPPPPSGCIGPVSHINLVRCRTQAIATTTATLNVVEPTVTVRISGTTYSKISRPDSHDQITSNSGYSCVLHDPGCGWWGNDGTDTFFDQKALPAGAKVEKVDFIQYWPVGIDSATGSGAWTWLDSSGSYFAHLNQDDPNHPSVKWNNTCAAGFAGKNLWYSMSFLISMPKGTDLGEPAGDPGAMSPCLPSGYSPNPQVVSASTTTAPSGWEGQVQFCNTSNVVVNEYLHIRATLVTPYSDAQGGAGPMVEDNLPLQFSPAGVSGSSSGFKTAYTYKQGTWKITDVYLTTTPASPPNAMVKNAVHLPGLPATPVNAALPGNAGSPVFNFTGGTCP